MQLERPEVEGKADSKRRFRRAALGVLSFAACLWLILLADALATLDLRQWGTRPGDWSGLAGLLFMPLLHGGISHLISNTLPLVLLGFGLLFFYRETAFRILPWIWVVPGLFVWVIGESGSTHYGASGLNFALLGYLGLGGLLRRSAATLALSLVILFYYGTMLDGVLPVEDGVSWESHLGGLLTGLVLAIIYRHQDIPPRRRYDWEDEEDEEDPENLSVD